MNSRIKRVYESGRKLKFTIARPDGKPKGAPLQPLPESETPNLYIAIPLTTPESGDMEMVYPADEKVTWEGEPLYWEGDPLVTEGDAIESLCGEWKPEDAAPAKCWGIIKMIPGWIFKKTSNLIGAIIVAIIATFVATILIDILGDFGWIGKIKIIIYNIFTSK